jgi:ATP-dependent exoDNAse (exonuclease V) alpha subunit
MDQLQPIIDRDELAPSLAGRGFTDGQLEAVHLALTTHHRFVGVQGYAGTGKTTALEAVRAIAEEHGYQVRGLAPSATAARLLSSEAGIQSQTVASFLLELNKTRPGARELWIVDEVSMVGNKQALAVLEAAKERGARVLLVGDRDQLPSIEAGKAFALLSDRGLPLASMDEILRQQNRVLLAAVRRTIEKDVSGAVELLRDGVHQIRGRRDRLQAVAKAYAKLPEKERARALVLTGSNQDRLELNEGIRRELRQKGLFGKEEVLADTLKARGFTRAQTKDAAAYALDNVVRFGRAHRRLGIEAGEQYRVTAIDSARNQLTLEREGRSFAWEPHRHGRVEVYESERHYIAVGDRIRWTRNDKELDRRNGETAEVLSLDAEKRTATIQFGKTTQTLHLDRERFWDHAYASTVHAAQGKTVDRVIVHFDTNQRHLVGHESFYVALSRARRDVQIFTNDVRSLPDALAKSLTQEPALDRQHARVLGTPTAPEQQRVQRHQDPFERALGPGLDHGWSR